MARARKSIEALAVSEVSAVDEPAVPGAEFVITKAAHAVEGFGALRRSVGEKGGAEALAAFDAAVEAVNDDMASLVEKAADDAAGRAALSRMVHALGEAMVLAGAVEDDGARAEAVARNAEQFAAAVEKAKAGPKGEDPDAGGGRFKACADCPAPGKCAAKGGCAMETKGGPMEKAAGVAGALALYAGRVEKAAATFSELNADREERDALNRMTWALQDSISSIMSDPAAKDKASLIRRSVAEFDAAVADLLGEIDDGGVEKSAGGGDGGGGSAQRTQQEAGMAIQGNGAAANAAVEDVIKSLSGKVEAFEQRQRQTEAINKAATLLPHGGPVAELAGLFENATPEQAQRLEGVVKALVAQGGTSVLFKSVGTAAAGEGTVVEEAPIVKAAKAIREQHERGRRAA